MSALVIDLAEARRRRRPPKAGPPPPPAVMSVQWPIFSALVFTMPVWVMVPVMMSVGAAASARA